MNNNCNNSSRREYHIGFLAPTAYRYFQGKGFGGAELQVINLSKMFHEAGYRVSILTNYSGQPSRKYYDGIQIVKAPLRFLGRSNFFFLPDTIRFIHIVRSLRLDFCFIKTPNTALFQLGIAKLLSKNLNIGKIFASDGDSVIDCSIADQLYRFGLKSADIIVFQTVKQQRDAKKILKVDGTVIPNIFYPPQSENATNPCIVEKDFDILWVGAFDAKKCPQDLYEIARRLPQYRFAVISKPVTERYSVLEKKISTLPNVTYFGMIPFQHTQHFFNRAKLLLCTSVIEGFPNTFLQAWYAGIPVFSLTFSCDGILTKNHAGIVSGSIEQLEKDLTKVLNNPQQLHELGENGRQYLYEHHWADKILSQYEMILKPFFHKNCSRN